MCFVEKELNQVCNGEFFWVCQRPNEIGLKDSRPPDLSRSLWASLFGQGPKEKTGSELGLSLLSPGFSILQPPSAFTPLLYRLDGCPQAQPLSTMTLSSLHHCPSDSQAWPWSCLFCPYTQVADSGWSKPHSPAHTWTPLQITAGHLALPSSLLLATVFHSLQKDF